jgi:hypothetical protein
MELPLIEKEPKRNETDYRRDVEKDNGAPSATHTTGCAYVGYKPAGEDVPQGDYH